MRYLAHISKDKLREERILEHAQRVADTAEGFASEFHAGSWGYCCGMIHDIGKYSREFSLRLQGGPLVDHATAGAKELVGKGGLYPLAAYCVAGHHAGLPDGGEVGDASDNSRLKGRMKKRVPDYMDYKKEIAIPPLENPEIKIFDKGGFSVSFFIRMVYSCLVDADFLETESFMSEGVVSRQPGCVSKKLTERLMEYIGSWLKNQNRDTVNGRRTEILSHCLEMGKKKLEPGEPGVYSLTVPTGGGKTIASLAFALWHAYINGKKRIIYVIPFTSIIEQNAEIFRSILGEENVLENHSQVQYDDREEFQPMQLAAENWDKPVVVTTNVQFFESLFANKSSRCRKLHNIANSVIIFDEAQMLPPSYLRPCVRAMGELAVNYRSTIVLCTATQPCLSEFFPKGLRIQELCPNMQEQFAFFKRARIENIGVVSEEELVKRLSMETQALCILNNRKRVQKIYRQLKGEGVYHLSTLMYPIHRKRILEEIRLRLREGKKCVVIATSLVEAGVDLDFYHVYREMAGVDSMVQAAGRCNREGKQSLEDSITYIFQMEERMGVIDELKQSIEVGRTVAEKFADITSLEAIQDYFTRLHELKGAQLDQKEIIKRLDEGVSRGDYAFASIAKDFRLIEEATKAVIIPKEEWAKELVMRLRNQERSKELIREIGNYSVPIYQQDFEKLRGWYVEELDTEIAVLRNLDDYSWDVGLELKVGVGEAMFIG